MVLGGEVVEEVVVLLEHLLGEEIIVLNQLDGLELVSLADPGQLVLGGTEIALDMNTGMTDHTLGLYSPSRRTTLPFSSLSILRMKALLQRIRVISSPSTSSSASSGSRRIVLPM